MKKVFFISGVCILVFLSFIIFKIKSAPYQAMQKPEPVVLPVHTLQNQSFTYTKTFIGSVQAIQSVAIVPYLSAFLKEVRVRAGEEVNEGDALFLLDERIPLADLNQAKEAVSEAYATRENALNYYERMKNTESKAISPTELEQAKTGFDAAEAAYQKSLAAQNQAQTLYDYTIIQAPISGWVGNITATVGEYLSPESVVISGEDFSAIKNKIGKLLSPLEMDALEGYIEGRSYQEISIATGHPVKSIDNALQRVKHKLERYLESRSEQERN